MIKCFGFLSDNERCLYVWGKKTVILLKRGVRLCVCAHCVCVHIVCVCVCVCAHCVCVCVCVCVCACVCVLLFLLNFAIFVQQPLSK